MKKFIFISILFFIFAFQVQAQTQLHAGPTGGGLYTRSYSSYSRNSSGKSYESSSSKHYVLSSGKSYSYLFAIQFDPEYQKNSRLYIDAMYKAYGSNKSADSLKQAKPTAVDRRREFSENK